MSDQNTPNHLPSKHNGMPPAETGNASNPTPKGDSLHAQTTHQLLDEKAEKYLREGGNIEDMPDAEERAEIDKK